MFIMATSATKRFLHDRECRKILSLLLLHMVALPVAPAFSTYRNNQRKETDITCIRATPMSSALFATRNVNNGIPGKEEEIDSSQRGQLKQAKPTIDRLVLELIQQEDLVRGELHERCLSSLRSLPRQDLARNAIQQYVKQKFMRKQRGMEPIGNPTSYVLAIARNLMDREGISAPTSQNREAAPPIETNSSRRSDIPPKVSTKTSKSTPTPKASRKITRKENKDITALTTVAPEGTAPSRSLPPLKTLPKKDGTKNVKSRSSKNIKKSATVAVPAKGAMSEKAAKSIDVLRRLEQPISTLPGVGPKTSALFKKLGLHTVRSLLWHFPTRFVDRSKLCHDIRTAKIGQLVTIILTVEDFSSGRGSPVLQICCRDEKGNPVQLSFFHGTSPSGRRLAAAIRGKVGNPGTRRIVSGKLQHSTQYEYQITQPDIVKPVEEIDSVAKVEPVYRLTQGLTQNKFTKAVTAALSLAQELLAIVPESLPPSLLQALGWPTLGEALEAAHQPMVYHGGVDSPARKRLAFEELSLQQAHLALTRWRYKQPYGARNDVRASSSPQSYQNSPLVNMAMSLLPFELTGSQERCLLELWEDALATGGKGRMARLLQGDVGCGKTVVAYLLGLGCLEQFGGVAAMLAPTTVLASQHEDSLLEFVSALNMKLASNPLPNNVLRRIHVVLLTGGVVGGRREEILSQIENHASDEAYFLVGTHALLSDTVAYRLQGLSGGMGLSLAVVDEEQRFGVVQRRALSKCAAHTLYMTATPIPRTLALGGYSTGGSPFIKSIRTGSMDVSYLDTKPKGAKPVKTSVVDSKFVDEVINAVKRQISQGAKVFWILPFIGDGEENDATGETDRSEKETLSVLERFKVLSMELGEGRVGMVHGRMSVKDRRQELGAFAGAASGVDLLVGTTVLEVGIDIPLVTVLVVEGAERFGLSQLHQLRGRIGRSAQKHTDAQAYKRNDLECHCVLMAESKPEEEETKTSNIAKRLNVLRRTNDGAQVAMADFAIRGPGEVIGLQQHGLRNGYAIDLSKHHDLIFAASIYGRSFIEKGDFPRGVCIGDDASQGTTSTIGGNEGLYLARQLDTIRQHSMMTEIEPRSSAGFRLRAGLALFGKWKTPYDEANTLATFSNLRDFTQNAYSLPEEDLDVETMFQSFAESVASVEVDALNQDAAEFTDYFDDSVVLNEIVEEEASNSEYCKPGTPELRIIDTLPEQSQKIPVTSYPMSRRTRNRHQVTHTHSTMKTGSTAREVVYLVLDVETTGLSNDCHIIQLAAKVLGAEGEDYQFSQFCCPPVTLDKNIEKLTGITDKFLRSGVSNNPAPPFSETFHDFCAFCNKIRKGRPICMLAHNAPFDIRMLNNEVKRLAISARESGKGNMPLFSKDTGILYSIDTLQLAKSKSFWSRPRSQRPPAYGLENIYVHIFNEPMAMAHNAMGDVMSLEKIILSDNLKGWEIVGKRIQKPLAIPRNMFGGARLL